LKGGPSHGISAGGDNYSTDKEMKELIAASATAEEFKASLIEAGTGRRGGAVLV
jgi:hypothetical protein